MTSNGDPEKLAQAKKVLRNALIGLTLVLGAAVLTGVLSHAYSSSSAPATQSLPSLGSIPAVPSSNPLVNVIVKAINAIMLSIVQSIANPLINILSQFTIATPLMSNNSSVFNMWLLIVGITDVLFVLIVALLGFHIMSSEALGFDELDIRQLLPQIGLVFLLANTSIFVIDGVISLSNAMISAFRAGFPPTPVWSVLSTIVKESGSLGLAALAIMLAFVVLALLLVLYYLSRIVALFLGAVLSPLVLLLWLIPAFKDFAVTAAKVYFTLIFVLFVHVVILELAASLFLGFAKNGTNGGPDPVMAALLGMATLLALLKTQGFMAQLSYVSSGSRSAKKLGIVFIRSASNLSREIKRGWSEGYDEGGNTSGKTPNPSQPMPPMTTQPAPQGQTTWEAPPVAAPMPEPAYANVEPSPEPVRSKRSAAEPMPEGAAS